MNKSSNPLRIFTFDQLNELNPSTLNRMKEKFLREFQLSSETTIEFNGFPLDKNGVLEVFDELNENLPFYLFVKENRTLNTFFNLGNVALFNDQKIIDKIKSNLELKEAIEQQIVHKIKPIISALVMNPLSRSSELDSAIHFINKLNPSLMNEASSLAFQELDIHIKYLEDSYPSPFLRQNDHFRIDLGNHISLAYYRKLKSLPEVFQSLIQRYGFWCDNIVNQSLREKPLKDFSFEELRIIKEAANIASYFSNKEGNLKIVFTIDDLLKSSKKRLTYDTNNGFSVGSVLILILIILRFGFLTNDSDDAKNFIDYDEIMETRKRMAEEKAAKRKIFSTEISGEKIETINAKLISKKEYRDFTQLNFEADAPPSNYAGFYGLVPDEVYQKHKGKMRNVVMSFKHPSLKGLRLKHKLKFDFTSNSTFFAQEYLLKNMESKSDSMLTILEIPHSKYPLNGAIDKFNSRSKTKIDSSTFSITYDKTKEAFKVNLKPANTTLYISKDSIENFEVSKNMQDDDRFAILIKNMNLLDSKNLTHGEFQRLDNVCTYTNDRTHPTMFEESVRLKYYFTSSEDNTAYITAIGENSNINYYVDNKTGIPKGLTMITSSKYSDRLERIVLFTRK